MNVAICYVPLRGGEIPPAAALAGRRVRGAPDEVEKPLGKLGKSVKATLVGKLHQEPPKKLGRTIKNDRRTSRMVFYNGTQ